MYDKYLSNLNNLNKLILFYSIFIVLISISSLLLSHLFILKNIVNLDNDLNIVIKKIPFFWGQLVSSIYNDFSFTTEGGEGNFTFYLQKFPLPALYLALILKISKNIYIFMLIKNIISSTFIFFTLYFFLINNKKNFLFLIILILAIFLVPYNSSTIFTFIYADHLTSFLVPLLFLSLINENKKNYFFIGFLIFFLYLTKPSMFFICGVIPFVIIYLDWNKKNFLKFIPLFFLLTAISIWGFYGLAKTGKFPFGKNLLSNNSFDLVGIANPDFIKRYPHVTIDTAQQALVYNINTNKFESEWDYYDAFDKMNKKYMADNFSEYLRGIPKKINFVFFYIYKDNIQPEEYKAIGNKIRYSSIINRLSLNLAFLIALYTLLKNFRNILSFKTEIYYLAIVGLNLLPHIYAWATNKHLVGIYITSNLYLIFKFLSKKKVFNET